MNRAKALKLNMLTGWLSELVTLITGLILPRLILTTFGSSYNGLVGAIGQYMGFTTVLRAGLGAVTRAALFKPLADNDQDKISSIIASTNIFMRKVSLMILGYVVLFAILFPFLTTGEYGWFETFAMVLIIGSVVIIENCFAIKYKILLQADQKYYVQTLSIVLSRILSFIVTVILIKLGYNMHMVKLGAAIAALTDPLWLSIYVKKHYKIDKNAKPDNSAIKQRWDAFTQQIAVVVNGNVDLVLMSFFVQLKEISVYTVHSMVTINIQKLITSMINGINATFGNMIAHKEEENLKNTFLFIEWGLFAACALVFSVTSVMLTPFIGIYTDSVTDVNYIRPVFAFAMTLVAMMNCMRLPYQMLTEAAGHFKQTRNASIWEVFVNIGVSLVMLYYFGIIGVIIGTFVAAVIRTAQFALYSFKHILNFPVWYLAKSYLLYFATFILITWIFRSVPTMEMTGYLQWIMYAAIVGMTAFVIVAIVSLIFNREQVLYLKRRFEKKAKK